MNFNEAIDQVLLNEYTGSEKKKTILMGGHKYLLKLPDPVREKETELSYINNAISEYLGCKIFKMLGIPVQNVILGTYTDENKKRKIVCACEDVRLPGETMYQIKTLELSDAEETKKKPSFDKMEQFAETFSYLSKEEICEFYYQMFVADAFIGNTDRHDGNWAILSGTGGVRLSPVFDCGSCLNPLLSEEEIKDEQVIKQSALSVYSTICDTSGKRILYRDFLQKTDHPGVLQAVRTIVPRINLSEIYAMIEDTPYLSENRKTFYKTVLEMNYEQVMLPALSHAANYEWNILRKYSDEERHLLMKTILEPLKRDGELNRGGFHIKKVAGNQAIIYKQGEFLAIFPVQKKFIVMDRLLSLLEKESIPVDFFQRGESKKGINKRSDR